MKRYIYACLHVIGFINASSTTNSIDAMLPPIPAAVINNMINKSLIEVSHTHPQALSSSIGETFLTVYMLGGIHTLFHMPPVVLQARTYIQTILADEHLMRLYAGAKKINFPAASSGVLIFLKDFYLHEERLAKISCRKNGILFM